MGCKHSYYKDDNIYYPRLYCDIDDKYCIFSKRCDVVNKYIPLDNFDEKECYKYVMGEQKNIPIGSYWVQTYRPCKRGGLYLYVVVNDKIEKVSMDSQELKQNYVYLKEDIDGYKVSLVPFSSEPKPKNTKSQNKNKTQRKYE